MQLFGSNGPYARNGHMVQKHFDEWQMTQRGKKNKSENTGLSLTGRGWGFPLAAKNEAPAYFPRKTEEK